MCGRYYLQVESAGPQVRALLLQLAHTTPPEALAQMKTGEIFPGDVAPLLASEGPRLMQWGYTGHPNRVINARSETAAEKPMFRQSLLRRRCLIPASGYFEWRRTAHGNKTKDKYAFFHPEGPLYLAGLWREERTRPLPVFVILTRSAPPEIADIHNRMPVLLPEKAREAWLGGVDAAPLLNQAETRVDYAPV